MSDFLRCFVCLFVAGSKGQRQAALQYQVDLCAQRARDEWLVETWILYVGCE